MVIKGTGKVGKWISDKMWQVGQIKDIIAIPFMATTTTGVYYPIILTWLIEQGIIIEGWVVFWGMMSSSFVLFILLGIFYDRGLKFWKHRRTTDVERNQYTTYRFYPIQIPIYANWLKQYRAVQYMAEELGATKAAKIAKEQADEFESWVKQGGIRD